MSLKLGRSFDRNYTIRLPFLNGYYDIGLFYNRKSTFLLFNVESGLHESENEGVKINMYKNLESSKFCETFLELHNYRKNTLDIINQFKCLKDEYSHEISFILNETITLAKVEIDDRVFYDSLNVYGFTMNSYNNEFIYVITERQNIVKKLGRKIVRTSGLQIATSSAMKMLNEYHKDSLLGKAGFEKIVPINKDDKTIIKLD